WLNADEIATLMNVCDYGVLPYDREDFHLSLPNKFIEYLAGGLPVLSCTEGEVRRFIEAERCGTWAPPTAADFAAAIEGLVIAPEQIASAKENAIRAFGFFGEDAVFGLALKNLEAVVAKKRTSRPTDL